MEGTATADNDDNDAKDAKDDKDDKDAKVDKDDDVAANQDGQRTERHWQAAD